MAERLRDEAGKEPGALPLLEHALDALWREREGRRLTRAAYERLGGLAGALRKQLDFMWNGLLPRQQRHGRRLLAGLVDIAQDVSLSTRRRGWVEKLRPRSAEAGKAFDGVLEALVAQRLLVRGRLEEGEEAGAAERGGWVEVAHEALIRRWRRLQGWLEAEKQRAQRRKVLAAYGLAAAAVVAVVAIGVLARDAYAQRERAEEVISKALKVASEVVWTADRELRPIGGAGPVRRKLLERVGALQDELRSASGAGVEATRLRMVTHGQRGDVALSHEDLKKARAEYEAARKLAEALAKGDPTNTGLQRNLSVSYNKLAKVAQEGGDLKEARELYSKALAIAEALAKGDPTNAGLQRDLSVSYERLGNVAQEGGDLKEARELYSKALAIAEALAKGTRRKGAAARPLRQLREAGSAGCRGSREGARMAREGAAPAKEAGGE